MTLLLLPSLDIISHEGLRIAPSLVTQRSSLHTCIVGRISTTRIYKALGKAPTTTNRIHASRTLHQPATGNRGRSTPRAPSSTADAQSPLTTPPPPSPRNHLARKDFSKAEHDTVDER